MSAATARVWEKIYSLAYAGLFYISASLGVLQPQSLSG